MGEPDGDRVEIVVRHPHGGSAVRRVALCLALVLTACGGPSADGGPDGVDESTSSAEAPPTALDLNGIWLQVEDPDALGTLVRFYPDGTFESDDRGELFAGAAAIGTFEVANDSVVFAADERSDVCADGDSWAWRATLPADGLLHVENTEEGTGGCLVTQGTRWTLIRVYLPSATARTITAETPTGGPPPHASELKGIWLQVDPLGVMVRFTSDGSFAIDDGGNFTDPSVSGDYRLKRGTITFPHVAGHACPGDTFAWRARLPEDGLLRVEHIREATGSCLTPDGTLWTLVRISPRSEASARVTAQAIAE